MEKKLSFKNFFFFKGWISSNTKKFACRYYTIFKRLFDSNGSVIEERSSVTKAKNCQKYLFVSPPRTSVLAESRLTPYTWLAGIKRDDSGVAHSNVDQGSLRMCIIYAYNCPLCPGLGRFQERQTTIWKLRMSNNHPSSLWCSGAIEL